MVGVPLLMVVLMSLRTGFPGEGGPLTLANFVTVYSAPSTLQDTSQHAALRFRHRYCRFGFCGAAGLVAQPHRRSAQEYDLRFDDSGNFDSGFFAHHRLDSSAQPAHRFGQSMGDATLQSRSADHQSLQYSGNGICPGSFIRAVGVLHALCGVSNHGPGPRRSRLHVGYRKLQTFLRINVPITWPAIAGVMVYLFMSALAVFEVPAIIGFPARILVLSASIFTATNPPTGLPNYGIAGAYGAVMLLAGLILAYFYVRLVQHGKKYTVITGRGYRPRQIGLGKWKWAALGFAFLYLSMKFSFRF
jgi:hypothetical protein